MKTTVSSHRAMVGGDARKAYYASPRARPHARVVACRTLDARQTTAFSSTGRAVPQQWWEAAQAGQQCPRGHAPGAYAQAAPVASSPVAPPADVLHNGQQTTTTKQELDASSPTIALCTIGLAALVSNQDPVVHSMGASALAAASLSSFINGLIAGKPSEAAAVAAAAAAVQHQQQAVLVEALSQVAQAHATVARQQDQIQLLERRVENLQVTSAGYEHASRNTAAMLRDCESECVALHARLERQKRNPGSPDVSTDPVLERSVECIMRDEIVDKLLRDRERAAQQIGQLEAQLEVARARLAMAAFD